MRIHLTVSMKIQSPSWPEFETMPFSDWHSQGVLHSRAKEWTNSTITDLRIGRRWSSKENQVSFKKEMTLRQSPWSLLSSKFLIKWMLRRNNRFFHQLGLSSWGTKKSAYLCGTDWICPVPNPATGDLGIFRALNGVLIFVDALAQRSLQVSHLVKDFSFSSLHSLLSAGSGLQRPQLSLALLTVLRVCVNYMKERNDKPFVGKFCFPFGVWIEMASSAKARGVSR